MALASQQRFAPSLALPLLMLGGLGAGCHYTEIREQCPTCTVVSRHAAPPDLPPGTRTLFLIVPGLLGFGWEWDEPLALLRAVPDSTIEAFSWRPSASAARSAADLARTVNVLVRQGDRLEELIVIGHSAGGLVTSLAGAQFEVPPGRAVRIVNIGTPYAGMHTMPSEYPQNAWRSPLFFAIGGTFSAYPPLAAGVTLESWVTPWPGDPVMKPRFGHHPDDPRVGPPGPRHLAPPGTDHNRFIARVVAEIAKSVTARVALRR